MEEVGLFMEAFLIWEVDLVIFLARVISGANLNFSNGVGRALSFSLLTFCTADPFPYEVVQSGHLS